MRKGAIRLIVIIAIVSIAIIFVVGRGTIPPEDSEKKKEIADGNSQESGINVSGLDDDFESSKTGDSQGSGSSGRGATESERSSGGGSGISGIDFNGNMEDFFDITNDNTGNTRVEREISNFVLGEKSEVILHIMSTENVIGIREAEGMVSDWEIVGYDISENYEIFEFKDSTNEWIIADFDNEINADLTYTVIANVDSVEGKYFVSDGNQIFEEKIIGDLTQIQLSPDYGEEINQVVIVIGILLILIVLIFVLVKRRKENK